VVALDQPTVVEVAVVRGEDPFAEAPLGLPLAWSPSQTLAEGRRAVVAQLLAELKAQQQRIAELELELAISYSSRGVL
jgi:hypothetical protein